MSVLPVRIYGDLVLRQKAVEVAVFDEELKRLVEDMRDTMHAYSGIGLAGNQVGVAQRVAIVDVPLDDGERAVYPLVNPVVLARSGSETGEEGCLSIPGIYEEVARSYRVRVQARDERGAPFELEAEGWVARAIQHEIDHLDGVLFVDRLSPLRRQFLRRALEELARGEVPEGYHPPAAHGGPI
jgi:peptide deformylase